MKKFLGKYEAETEEHLEEELEIIDLDETAGWSKLEVAEALQKQKAEEWIEEIGDELAIIDVVEENLEINNMELLKKKRINTYTEEKFLGECLEKESNQVPEDELEELSDDDIEIETLLLDDIEETEPEYESDDWSDEEEESAGFFEGIGYWLSQWTIMDKVVAVTGVLVLMVAVLTVGIYAGKNQIDKQMEAFAPVGERLETVGVVGQDKLLTVADARKAKLEVAKLEAELNPEYEENEVSSAIKVIMKMTSVQKDLKIKFVNKKNGKLVGNVPFEVKITDPDNKTFHKIDEDKDGIIYLTNIVPGNYNVAMVELNGMDDYSFDTTGEKIKVKETIAYEKIDVSEEIKDQSEVDVAKEDTAQKIETEAVLTDTVEWVESTKTEIKSEETYTKVSKDTIQDPALSASLNLDFSILRMIQLGTVATTETVKEIAVRTASQNSTVAVTGIALNKTEISLEAGKSRTLTATLIPANAANKTIKWSSDKAEIATVDANGTITGKKAGVATITATAGSKSATCKVTVTGETTENKTDKKITLDPTTATLKVGENLTLKATVTSKEQKVVWTSSDTKKAEVNNGNVTAKATGEVTITATAGGESASCKITITKGSTAKDDTSTLLKDKSGNQIYVLIDGKYQEAKAADYYKYSTFYKKEKASSYTYTGWQNLDGKTYYYDKNGNKVTGEQIIQGAKYNFNSDGTLNTGSGILGIDVSTWNGNIDWNKVKNAGVSYVIIRTGFRGSTQGALVEDNRFRQNIQGATNAGIKVGVYFFSQAINEVEAVEEASMVLSQIKGYKITYPVFIDVEPSGGRGDKLSSGDRTKVINAFCQTIQNGGYRAGIYANKTWLSQKMNISALSGYKIWLAQYNSQVTYSGRYDMWQYSDKGNIPGIPEKVDMNLSYLTY